MKNYALPLGLIAIVAGVGIAIGAMRGEVGPAVNPDPNHTHADLAVRVNGQLLDFTDERYMSGEYVEGQLKRDDNAMRTYLHLHDGVGHVIHRHKPGLTLGDFFASIDIPMTTECLTLDAYQYEQLDDGWVEDFAITPELCTSGKFHWRMFVNGQETAFDPAYVFKDTDKILLTYGAGDIIPEEWLDVSDDACLYSRTCPERGDPPAENCIADPEVPCVIPE